MIDESKLTQAIEEFLQNEVWAEYFGNAPSGAKEIIALEFYASEIDTDDDAEFEQLEKECRESLDVEDIEYLAAKSPNAQERNFYANMLKEKGEGNKGEEAEGSTGATGETGAVVEEKKDETVEGATGASGETGATGQESVGGLTGATGEAMGTSGAEAIGVTGQSGMQPANLDTTGATGASGESGETGESAVSNGATGGSGNTGDKGSLFA